MDISLAKFRAIMRSKSGGAEFPLYLETREEASEAAAFLKADVVSVEPTDSGQYAIDMINALAKGSNVINR